MRCVDCGCDPNPVVLVPGRQKEKGGPIQDFSCLACATKAGVYCQKHEAPHIGFVGDDSTACLLCIEAEVQAAKDRPEEVEEIYNLLRWTLRQEEWERLNEAVELSSMVTGDEDSVSVLRFIVTRAHRLHLSSDDIVVQTLQRQTASLILPRLYW